MSQLLDMKNDLIDLISQGVIVKQAFLRDAINDEKELAIIDAKVPNIPKFKDVYDSWFTLSQRVVERILPERVEEFRLLYKNTKQKKLDASSYCIHDALLGLHSAMNSLKPFSAFQKLEIQLSILKSAQKCFDNSLMNIDTILQANLFDSELDAAKELQKRGFLRGAGAIAGVILEKHLKILCKKRGEASRKKKPTIADYNDVLKKIKLISLSQWRFIQHLTDLRNLCDHDKDIEPTPDDVSDLIAGVKKIIKTVTL